MLYPSEHYEQWMIDHSLPSWRTASILGTSISISLCQQFSSTKGWIFLCRLRKFTISVRSRSRISILLLRHCIRHSSPPMKQATTSTTSPQSMAFWCWEASGSPIRRQQSIVIWQYSLLCCLIGWLWSWCSQVEVLEVSCSRKQFSGQLDSEDSARQVTEGLATLTLRQRICSLVMMRKRSFSRWKNSLIWLPLNLTALQALVMMRGSRLKGQISRSYPFCSRNRKLSKVYSLQRSRRGWRQYWVGRVNTFIEFMNSSLLQNRTRLQLADSRSRAIYATLLPSTSLKLTKMVELQTRNWQLPPKALMETEKRGTAWLCLSSSKTQTPLQKSSTYRMLDTMATSCGNSRASLKWVSSVKVQSASWLGEGSGMMKTRSMRFKPTNTPDSPWSILSSPPTLALSKPERVPTFLTLLRMVLVSTAQMPRLLKMKSRFSAALRASAGGETVSYPICSSRQMNWCSLQVVIFSRECSLQMQAVSSEAAALRRQRRDLEASSTQLFCCHRVELTRLYSSGSEAMSCNTELDPSTKLHFRGRQSMLIGSWCSPCWVSSLDCSGVKCCWNCSAERGKAQKLWLFQGESNWGSGRLNCSPTVTSITPAALPLKVLWRRGGRELERAAVEATTSSRGSRGLSMRFKCLKQYDRERQYSCIRDKRRGIIGSRVPCTSRSFGWQNATNPSHQHPLDSSLLRPPPALPPVPDVAGVALTAAVVVEVPVDFSGRTSSCPE